MLFSAEEMNKQNFNKCDTLIPFPKYFNRARKWTKLISLL